MNQNILQTLNEIFQDIFDDDSIQLSEQTIISEIDGWDSLIHISIIAAIQDEFSISFDMDEITKFNRVEDMISAIEEKLI